MLFGQSTRKAARALNVDARAAVDAVQRVRALFPALDAYRATVTAACREHGFVETVLGRRRRLPDIHSTDPKRRRKAERQALNAVVQGSAADLIKLAMLDLHRCLPEEAPGTKMLLQIHDELVFEVPEAEIEPVTRLVIERMEGAMALDVPLVVDAAHGRDWFAAK